MSKRKNGEGSWGKKTINGYQYHYYRDPDGKYTYGKTIKEINEKIKKKEKDKYVLNDKTTFGEYITQWLVNIKFNTLEPTTYDCYETMILSQIINFKGFNIADKQLHQLSSEMFQKYLNSLAEHFSRSTIRKIWTIIKQCINYAEIKGEIQPNTTKLVKVPTESIVSVKKKDVPFLSKEDAELFYEAAQATKPNGQSLYGINANIAVFIMYSGLRVSEALALKWKNVDFENNKIRVVESLASKIDRSGNANKVYIEYDKQPKSADGIRIVPLPSRAMAILKDLDVKNKNHAFSDYVFTNKNGNTVDRRIVNKTIKAIANRSKCSVKDFSVHSLRHTYGSILLAEGVDIKKVSELLGHSDITITYNIYIGILEKDKQKEIERVFG